MENKKIQKGISLLIAGNEQKKRKLNFEKKTKIKV